MQEPVQVATSDPMVERWRVRAVADGPVAFRAIVRAVEDDANSTAKTPGRLCAALILHGLYAGEERSTRLLAQLMETANHSEWFEASRHVSSFDFMTAYGEAFLPAFVDAARQFGTDDRTVQDLLAEGSPTDELRWRGALAAVEQLPPDGVVMPRSDGGRGRPRFVVYQYCVSLGIVTFKRTSPVKMIPPGGSAVRAGLFYTLLSLVGGWWGIPWGPIYTLEAIAKNLGGGIDVTDAVMARV